MFTIQMEVERSLCSSWWPQDLFSEEYYVNVSQRGIASLVSDLDKVPMPVGREKMVLGGCLREASLSNGGLLYRESTVVKRCLPAARGTDCAMRDSGIAGAGWQGRKVRSTYDLLERLGDRDCERRLREHTDCMNFY